VTPTAHLPVTKIVELYLHCSVSLHGVVLNHLSTGILQNEQKIHDKFTEEIMTPYRRYRKRK
jgi:hypothetical protein